MAHYTEIKDRLKVGDTVAYPASGNTTSKLNVTAVSDEENAQYCLSSKDGKFNVNEYHSSLMNRINGNQKEDSPLNRESLKLEAIELEIDHAKNISTKKLQALIEAHKNKAV